ncbi:MAG: hypothetical protein AVDCRST_MAG95-3563 [uncultured Adhaeribacter sp.]|uniref:Uncharacterized protein n=1 Tax=uncultured Adhaeribacter sp. TaxID=448109 RepID=A0A6J4JQU8_9BACT|nr:MAG: hypothetical protein AVDCRST_MAG95-3563 [uncultured Adhaeribacter sp.]
MRQIIYLFKGVSLLLLFLLLGGKTMAQKPVPREIISRVNAGIQTGDKHLLANNTDSARYYFLQAEKLSRQYNYQRGIADFISYYISVLNREGKYDEALKLTLESVKICRNLKNGKLLAIAYNNVGEEYNYLGNLKAAATHYLKALKVSQSISNVPFQQLLNNNLASVFLKLNDKDKGYFYAYQSYQLAVQR